MNEDNHNHLPNGLSPDQINTHNRNTLMETLGIIFTHVSPERTEAVMPVGRQVCQPFGILHGGATLALAESVAGQGSLLLCETDEVPAGIQVSCNHVSSAREGDKVRAVGTIIHKGRTIHVWNIDIFTSSNKLVSSVRVVNSILKRR
jgi:uncharacterized protein (TIGR00369 family)